MESELRTLRHQYALSSHINLNNNDDNNNNHSDGEEQEQRNYQVNGERKSSSPAEKRVKSE